jgi:hypothetical protein
MATKEMLKTAMESINQEMLNAASKTIDSLVDNLLVDRITAYDPNYHYSWYDPAVYEHPLLKKYSRDELPNIIRVIEGIHINQRSDAEQCKQEIHQEECQTRMNYPNSQPYPVGYIPNHILSRISNHDNRRHTLFITLEGDYFLQFEVVIFGMKSVFDRMQKNKLPLRKSIYNRIMEYTNTNTDKRNNYWNDIELSQIFAEPNNTSQLIRHYWFPEHPLEVGLQLYKTEMLNKDTKANLDQIKDLNAQLQVEREFYEAERKHRDEQYELRMNQLAEREAECAKDREKLIRQSALIRQRQTEVIEKVRKNDKIENLQAITRRLYNILLETELLLPDYADEIAGLINDLKIDDLPVDDNESTSTSSQKKRSKVATAVPVKDTKSPQ